MRGCRLDSQPGVAHGLRREGPHLSGDGDLDLDTGLDVDDDLLDDLGGGVEAVHLTSGLVENSPFVRPKEEDGEGR